MVGKEFLVSRLRLDVRVYVEDDAEPSLVVNALTDRTGGRIGLWIGNNSDGSFADLVIRPSGR
jgi:hypothetical protein